MNYATIKKNDVANGPGIRASVFVSGCRHACPGCFNSEAWDFGYGAELTDEVADSVIDACKRPFIDGLSVLGGEPFEPENQEGVLKLLRAFKAAYPQKSVWCYTGFTLDAELLSEHSRARTEHTDEMLSYIDILVDGRFVEAKRDLTLRFRGSSNQRIIDMKQTMKNGRIEKIVLWDESADSVNFTQ